MKDKQENKLSMYYAVQKVCSANSGVWSGLPAFVTAFADFETNIGKIEDALEAQEKNITGVSKDKDAIGTLMVEKALQVGGAVFAYASDINDLTLKGKVDFSRTELKRVRDSIATQRCQLIHDEANGVIGSLGSYGVTGTDLSDLQTKIDAFASAVAAPRTAITERKGATDEIAKFLRKCDSILKSKLDKLMNQFKVSAPRFYKLYFDARIIVDIGIRHEDETPPTT